MIGHEIAQRRQAMGLTQAELADELAMSQAMVARVERGSKEPPLWMVKAAAELFHCSTDALIFGAERDSA